MHPYVLIPLIACVAAAALASAMVSRAPGDRRGWLGACAMGCGGLWAGLQVLWNQAPDVDQALALVRLASFPTLLLPAVVLHLVLSARGGDTDRFRWMLRAAYAVGLSFGVLVIATPWFVSQAVPTQWGYSYRVGPAFLLLPLVVALPPVLVLARVVPERRRAHPLERAIAPRLLWVATALPLLAVALTDVLLPLLGVSAIQLGSASIVSMGGSLWLLSLRLGPPELAANAFARETLDTLPDGVALVGRDRIIRSVNRTLAQLAGSAPGALVGESVDVLAAGELDLEQLCRADLETMLPRPGRGPAAVSISASPVRDRQHGHIGHALVVRDQREMVELRRRLVTAGRLAAVGELAAGIAHEVNNPISFIQANLNLLYRDFEEVRAELVKHAPEASLPRSLDEGRHLIGASLEGISQVASIVREVRGFAHAGLGDRHRADVNELLESAVRLALPQLRRVAHVERRFEEVPAVWCAQQELKQVFLNLVLRAGRKGGATITLVTEAAPGHVVVRVEDDGDSAPVEQLERAFDPLFRADGEADDAQLELAISYQIVRQHGGEMEISSLTPCGTRVRLAIPLGSMRCGDGEEDGPCTTSS